MMTVTVQHSVTRDFVMRDSDYATRYYVMTDLLTRGIARQQIDEDPGYGIQHFDEL